MATQGNYYLDAATLTLATAVYTDAGLTTLAPDGFYGNGSIVREQVLGVLQTESACSGCGTLVSQALLQPLQLVLLQQVLQLVQQNY